jgi:hypothetical protein
MGKIDRMIIKNQRNTLGCYATKLQMGVKFSVTSRMRVFIVRFRSAEIPTFNNDMN